MRAFATPSEERSRRLRVTLLAVGITLAVNAALVLTDASGGFTRRHQLASVMLWVSVYPSWSYFVRRERRIPFMPLLCLVYFCAYGLPAWSVDLQIRGRPIEPRLVEEALALALAGEVLLIVAFRAARFAWLPRFRQPLDLERGASALLVVGWLSFAFRLAAARQGTSPSLTQLAGFVWSLPALCGAALCLLVLRGRLAVAQRVALVALITGTLLLDFASAAVAQPLMTLVMLLFVYVAERHRLPLTALLASVLVIIASLGTKGEFRRIITREGDLATVERVELFSTLVGGVLTRGQTALEKASSVAESRVDHLSAFAYVIHETPASVPYWDGASYGDFAWSFVPRLIYPEKPMKTLGQEYGHRYNFIDRDDRRTSINLEQTVEMYANFGVIGVLVGMLLLGLLYRALDVVLCADDGGDGAVLVAAATFRTLLNIESDFSLVFGGLVQAAVLLALVLQLLAPQRAVAAR